MTDTMIVVPISSPPDPTCPNCGKPEKKKTICAHCGYTYEPDGGFFWGCASVVLIIVFAVWLLLTLGYWMLNSDMYGDDFTLLNVLKGQWEWVRHLRLR